MRPRLPAFLAAIGILLWAQAPSATAVPLTIAVAARALQPGEPVVVTVSSEAALVASTVKVRAFERASPVWQVDEHTVRALVGIDLDVVPGAYAVTVTEGTNRASHTLTVLAKAFPTRTLKVDEAFVNPPASALPKIAADQALINAVWASSVPSRLWTGAFVRPVPQPANSAFGTRSVYNGQKRSAHGGADFLSPAGTPIKAPAAGRIALAKNLYYTGNTVIIDHGLGFFSLFAHMSAIDAAEGASVAAGDVLGRVGATGRVTGPHLHWALRLGGARVDPLAVLELLR